MRLTSKEIEITRENAISFLIQCYFGSIEDPVLASIDRAYLDMQTHTISGDKKILYKRRKNETEILYGAIENIRNFETFDKWHKDTADRIKDECSKLKCELEYGQIQKWINMTVKYLFTLKLLVVNGISDYFKEDNSHAFHPALDSYVLNAIGEKVSWSKITEYKVYDSIRKKLAFVDEYLNWPKYANEAGLKKNGEKKLPEKGTYKRYVYCKGGYSFDKKSSKENKGYCKDESL